MKTKNKKSKKYVKVGDTYDSNKDECGFIKKGYCILFDSETYEVLYMSKDYKILGKLMTVLNSNRYRSRDVCMADSECQSNMPFETI